MGPSIHALLGKRRFMAKKNKTNSGAKKRMKLLPSGKVKRKQTRKRHLLEARSPKAKRQLTKRAYVNDANMLQAARLLNF